jgi:hypothetical protein
VQSAPAAPPATEPSVAAVDPPPPVAPPAPRRATVTLRASRAFCDPSLDQRPPGLSPNVYADITPGDHQVFCRMPDGEKVPLGNFRVLPQAQTILIVKDKQTGRPTLATAGPATEPRQNDPSSTEKPVRPGAEPPAPAP